ncbi:MAG: hypothetical protein C4567_17865 [Deltaproteobacteria bacterium]|nr:MAG: hypothetical protein C4567_17865 [Deltaproteobacteria bacterium]
MGKVKRLALYIGIDFVVFYVLWVVFSYLVGSLLCLCRLVQYSLSIFGIQSLVFFIILSGFDVYLALNNDNNFSSIHKRAIYTMIAVYFLTTIILFFIPYLNKSTTPF